MGPPFKYEAVWPQLSHMPWSQPCSKTQLNLSAKLFLVSGTHHTWPLCLEHSFSFSSLLPCHPPLTNYILSFSTHPTDLQLPIYAICPTTYSRDTSLVHPKSSPYPSPKSAYYSIQFIGLDNISHRGSGCTVSIIITLTKVSKCCFASPVRVTIITAPGLKIKNELFPICTIGVAHGRYSVFGYKLVHKFNKHWLKIATAPHGLDILEGWWKTVS